MSSIAILTDSAAHFTRPNFPGFELVEIVPLDPSEMQSDHEFVLNGPSDSQIQVILKSTSLKAGTVFAILTSGCLSSLPSQILKLMKENSTVPRIIIIDTQSAGVGTGFLVETAAEMAANDHTSSEIERKIRQYCASIYTIMILPDLSPLVPLGLVDRAQANAASILGIHSIFSMEEGLPTPLSKVKNRKGAYEFMIEFLDEFDSFHLTALLRENKTDSSDLQIITDHLKEFYPGQQLATMQTNRIWQSIFGKKSYGLVIVSNEDNNTL